jgi:hypothetical protein
MWQYFLLGLLGFALHIIKKEVKGEKVVSIWEYVKTYPKTLIVKFITYVLLFFVTQYYETMNAPTAVAIGYFTDSLWGKWEQKV